MTLRWRHAARLLTLGILVAASAPAAAPPVLVVEAPPRLAAVAETVRRINPESLRPAMRLVGRTDAGQPLPPIRVVLEPESSPTALSTPAWVSGFAATGDGRPPVVVLLAERVPRYPDGSLVELVQHEVTHVLIAQVAGNRPLPRWFHEGLAMAASRGTGLQDRTRVALAVLVEGRLPLADLDAAFAAGPPATYRAYALSLDFVDDLLRRHGDGVAAAILAGVARDEPFADAFAAAAGSTLAEVEASYWRRRTLWNRWVPVLTSSAALWIAITMLALAAFRRRAVRDAALRTRWDQEEQLAAPRLAADVAPSDDGDEVGQSDEKDQLVN